MAWISRVERKHTIKKNVLLKRNEKCGVGEPIEKIEKTSEFPASLTDGISFLKPVSKNWKR